MTAKRRRAPSPPALRIGAGRWKGRRLDVPAGARPTSGRAREALFSILSDSLPGSRVLDLYAGSGAIGLEAVSRGAAYAVLVERQPSVLDRNVSRLGASEAEVEVLRGLAADAVDLLRQRAERFDLIFSDPPYGSAPDSLFPPEIGALLAAGGLVIVQTDRLSASIREPESWTLLARRVYGRNVFFFLSPFESSLSLDAGHF
jgi:16S rRNA (guanine966-N2)-methyltransferase